MYVCMYVCMYVYIYIYIYIYTYIYVYWANTAIAYIHYREDRNVWLLAVHNLGKENNTADYVII